MPVGPALPISLRSPRIRRIRVLRLNLPRKASKFLAFLAFFENRHFHCTFHEDRGVKHGTMHKRKVLRSPRKRCRSIRRLEFTRKMACRISATLIRARQRALGLFLTPPKMIAFSSACRFQPSVTRSTAPSRFTLPLLGAPFFDAL